MTKTIADVHTQYGRLLLMLLRGFGVPADDREDVRQDIYVRLLQQKIDPERCTPSFLGSVAKSAANMYRRQRYGFLMCGACGERYTAKSGVCSACGTPHNKRQDVSLVEFDEDGNLEVNEELEQLAERQWVQAMEDSARHADAYYALDLARLYRCGATDYTAYDLINMLHNGWSHERMATECQVADRTVRKWLREWYKYITKELTDLENNERQVITLARKTDVQKPVKTKVEGGVRKGR